MDRVTATLLLAGLTLANGQGKSFRVLLIDPQSLQVIVIYCVVRGCWRWLLTRAMMGP